VKLGGQLLTAFPNNPRAGTYERYGLWYRRVDGSETGQDVVVELAGSDPEITPIGAIAISGLAASPNAQGLVEVSASNTTHDIGAITLTSAVNIVVGWSPYRANRAWTNAAGWTSVGATNDYTLVYDIDATSPRTWTFSTAEEAGLAYLALGSLEGAAADLAITDAHDDAVISEYLEAKLSPLLVSIYDSLSISESVTPSLDAPVVPLTVSLYDSLVVTDPPLTIEEIQDLVQNIQDSLHIGENVQAVLTAVHLEAVLTDLLHVAESVVATPSTIHMEVNLVDNIIAQEHLETPNNLYVDNLREALTITENIIARIKGKSTNTSHRFWKRFRH
jgi:hypothetical protein